MYFLKCAKCGHLNEVKSEYLIFCLQCNKKLENNFRDWQARNSEKTLDDFKQLLCISDAEINNNPVAKKKGNKSLKYWIGFAIALTISSIIGQLFSDKILEIVRFGKLSKSILEQEWIAEKYGQDGLSVETPYKLTSQQLPFPDNIRALMDYSVCYMNETKNGLVIMVNCIRYKPEIGAVSLQGAANGSVMEMKMQPGVKDFEYNEENISKGNIPGFQQKGTFIKEKTKVEFINVGFADGLAISQIMVAFKSDDEVGRKVAERVVSSIKFEELKKIL